MAEKKVPTLQVQATKSELVNEQKEVIKTVYNLIISNSEGKTKTLSVGEGTYKAIKEMTS